jgi:hypothetical protein
VASDANAIEKGLPVRRVLRHRRRAGAGKGEEQQQANEFHAGFHFVFIAFIAFIAFAYNRPDSDAAPR